MEHKADMKTEWLGPAGAVMVVLGVIGATTTVIFDIPRLLPFFLCMAPLGLILLYSEAWLDHRNYLKNRNEEE